jgi:SAM-dependent methyltransferase
VQAARRLELGQWFTPPEVADLALALALPGQRERLRVLDPACGDGVFLARARAAGCNDLVGIELDPEAAAAARAAVPGARIHQGDLFDLEPDQGFDVVVGNPPYVRQERIGPRQKDRVRLRLRADWPELEESEIERLVGRGDLAVAVLARALRLCRPGGRIAMVVSSALFDAGYAQPLWRLFSRVGRLLAVIDAPRERWFPAAVNTVIILAEVGRGPTAVGTGSMPAAVCNQKLFDPKCLFSGGIGFAQLRVPTAEAAARVRDLSDLPAVAEIRSVSASEPERWASALRAPSLWFELEARAGARLVPLGEIAEVSRGVTSGANDLFYLPRARAADLGLERALLAPLLRSPRQAGGETIAVDPAALDAVALIAPPEPRDLARFPATQHYFDSRAADADRPTLRARRSWWSLPVKPAQLFLTKAYAGRFVQRYSPVPVVADQRLYALHPRVPVDLLAAVLNSTFTALALESLGRSSLGEGALEWTVSDAERLPVIDPRTVTDPEAVRAAFAALAARPIGSVAEERRRDDRAALDQAIAGDLADLLPQAHEALCASVSRRAARARSAVD